MGVSHLDLINWTNRLKWLVGEVTGNKRKLVDCRLYFGNSADLHAGLTPLHFTWILQVCYSLIGSLETNKLSTRHVSQRGTLRKI